MRQMQVAGKEGLYNSTAKAGCYAADTTNMPSHANGPLAPVRPAPELSLRWPRRVLSPALAVFAHAKARGNARHAFAFTVVMAPSPDGPPRQALPLRCIASA